MYFGLWDGMSDRVYVAERADRRRYFSSANRVTILGTTLAPAEPFLSDDGLKLYFVTGSANSADRDIWSATRESTTLTTFSAAQAVAAVNSAYEEASPWLSEDELTLLFSTARPGGSGDLDIWRATRELATGAFSSPTVLAGVNSAGRDESPVLSQDGLTLYFTTTRESVTGKQDVWYATRNSLDEEFGVPAALEAVNSDAVETDIALSTDGAELFFVSDRLGSPQIWHATRGCE
jgi:Tol biopolymer transport system component